VFRNLAGQVFGTDFSED
jgi:hypothetical protein